MNYYVEAEVSHPRNVSQVLRAYISKEEVRVFYPLALTVARQGTSILRPNETTLDIQ